ncbi:hypothetical protein [Candidatus Carsonella ruddii]|uniref:hypothetical protein n=1 Tax=Carsonella ruddii TaxID=114186 RepID=UPI00035C017D|nr:hypothetical protein [Candidatus Carsonella ruddii]AGS06521.1 hypothetical protein CRDC_00165 [Candidatus Carsonella ruddii DC]ALA96781.1 hypothetical protein AMC76_00160 [Candidatus Carsonella ruddii]
MNKIILILLKICFVVSLINNLSYIILKKKFVEFAFLDISIIFSIFYYLGSMSLFFFNKKSENISFFKLNFFLTLLLFLFFFLLICDNIFISFILKYLTGLVCSYIYYLIDLFIEKKMKKNFTSIIMSEIYFASFVTQFYNDYLSKMDNNYYILLIIIIYLLKDTFIIMEEDEIENDFSIKYFLGKNNIFYTCFLFILTFLMTSYYFIQKTYFLNFSILGKDYFSSLGYSIFSFINFFIKDYRKEITIFISIISFIFFIYLNHSLSSIFNAINFNIGIFCCSTYFSYTNYIVKKDKNNLLTSFLNSFFFLLSYIFQLIMEIKAFFYFI